ncbi:MAG TPA: sulfatase-like hydrolase/transferase [Myxococcales bacterium]|nr:sulfatase-like hydrolase/transferase [Myxococcales bacterium]
MRARGLATDSRLAEMALRAAMALLPCAVLVRHLPAVLGERPLSWAVPLGIAFANAWLLISLARDLLSRTTFLAFWTCYGVAWTAVAWHGLHFHGPPRPAALLMNLGEISRTPLPDWAEMPWAVLCGAIALGWMAGRFPAPRPSSRHATFAAAAVFLSLHGATFLRYRNADMLRLSQYGDLVRIHGLEGAALMDAVVLLRAPETAGILRDLRLEAAAHPAAPLPLLPVAADRMVVIQVESLDQEAIARDVAPTLFHLWSGGTHGLVRPLRTSESGSSSADFELLTGLRPLAGIPAYRLAWDGDASGLPAYAASRGFAFHAYHGNDRHFWNRSPFFSAMGADFDGIEAIPQSEFSRWGRADGDLFRYGAARIRQTGRAIHFFITLSTHAPFDLVDPAAHMRGATQLERYQRSVAYLDAALGGFLGALPREGPTLLAIYGDHSSNLFSSAGAGEPPVPLILGRLAADGVLAPLRRSGAPAGPLPEVYELAALHRYLKECLDASAH